jgi:hypothetical protein
MRCIPARVGLAFNQPFPQTTAATTRWQSSGGTEPMALDPDFIKRVQERKAKREALEQKYAPGNAPARKTPSSPSRTSGSGKRKAGPVYRSVSMLDGHEVIISGDDARKRAQKAEFNG